MNRLLSRAVFAAALCATGVPVCAQDRPVEQGVADVDPLAESLRVVPHSLRHDSNFEHVYRLDGAGDFGPFYRRAGGIYAVFPRSEYYLTRRGVVAPVPPGTIYYLGKPEFDAPSPPVGPTDGSISGDRLRVTGASDQRFVGRLAPSMFRTERLDRTAPPPHERTIDPETEARPLPRVEAPARAVGVMSDSAYRARRLAEIAARHSGRG